MAILSLEKRNIVLQEMQQWLEHQREHIIDQNQQDLQAFAMDDVALYDRLKVDNQKVDEMIQSLAKVIEKEEPLDRDLYSYQHPNGMRVVNKTAPFGTILIIYESRPDVTIEAAAIAFKSGNKILLKGGKESIKTNLKLVECWHHALKQYHCEHDYIRYLDYSRQQTQDLLLKPKQKIDLIVPRGGEKLISFVKKNAFCPVLVSGRGNNFLYVHHSANLEMAKALILNAKTDKISACNALDKLLVDQSLPNYNDFVRSLSQLLSDHGVEVIKEDGVPGPGQLNDSDELWYEEFLDYKILIGGVQDLSQAIEKINKYSGGHSVTIVTEDADVAKKFMQTIDAAAVYHNASTRFTDGGQFGLGAELAISTDKMHHRGPLGLEQLVTNKWYIYGNGQGR